jgi:hypothetical protein
MFPESQDITLLRDEADNLFLELSYAMDARQANRKKYRLRELDLKQEVMVQQAFGKAGRTYWAILRLLVLWQPLSDSRREIVTGRLQQMRKTLDIVQSPIVLRASK